MIGLLFNRFSRAVLVAEAAGLALLTLGVVRIAHGGAGWLAYTLIAAALLMYAFIRICTSVRWYEGAPKYSGIELQFKKAMVPTSYALLICGAWLAILPSIAPLCVLDFALAVVAHVNVILLYFHRRDRDPTPVNYYSSGQFLRTDRNASRRH